MYGNFFHVLFSDIVLIYSVCKFLVLYMASHLYHILTGFCCCLFQGFNERLVMVSRPTIGVMFKKVNSVILYFHIFYLSTCLVMFACR
jgi:hypothetical protein